MPSEPPRLNTFIRSTCPSFKRNQGLRDAGSMRFTRTITIFSKLDVIASLGGAVDCICAATGHATTLLKRLMSARRLTRSLWWTRDPPAVCSAQSLARRIASGGHSVGAERLRRGRGFDKTELAQHVVFSFMPQIDFVATRPRLGNLSARLAGPETAIRKSRNGQQYPHGRVSYGVATVPFDADG